MENNNTCVATFVCNPTGSRQDWLVVISWVLLLGVGALVTIIATGPVPITWWFVYISICILCFSRRFVYDLLKPKKIEFYDKFIIVYVSGFDIKRKWIINYGDILVTCIGFKSQKRRRRIVVGDTTNYLHSCSLDYPAGWNDSLQEEVLAQLRETGITQLRYKS